MHGFESHQNNSSYKCKINSTKYEDFVKIKNEYLVVLKSFGKNKANKHDVFSSGATKGDHARLCLLIGQERVEEA